MADRLDVLIVGGGSTGLLLAQGLKQAGIKNSVYEREDRSTYQTRPREWGMTLHWGQDFINRCIPKDLQIRFNEVLCDPYYGDQDLTLPHYNGKTGEKIFAMPGHKPIRVSRKKLRNFLSDGLDIHYGKKLSDIKLNASGEEIIATFTDSTSASGTLLVGCDGANSVVREVLVGKELARLEELDIQMFNISCAYPTEVSKHLRTKHPCFKNSYHPDGFMYWLSIQDVKDPERPDTWLHQSALSWIGEPRVDQLPDQASRTAFFHKVADTFAEPWRSAGKEFPADLSFGLDHITVWNPSIGWDKSELYGHVTLAGDVSQVILESDREPTTNETSTQSAHVMPPHRGQGLNNGLQDAAMLVEQLDAVQKGEKSLKEAIVAYEEEMKKRTIEEIPLSIAQARMAHQFENLMNAPFIKHGMNKKIEEAGEGTTT